MGTQHRQEQRRRDEENTPHREKQCAFESHASTGWVCDEWKRGGLRCVEAVGSVHGCVVECGAVTVGRCKARQAACRVQSDQWRACEGKKRQSQNMESEGGAVNAKKK